MLRGALLLAAVFGLAAAYNTGYNDNDRYNNNNDNYYNNQNQQRFNNSQERIKDVFCFLNATNIVRHPYHAEDTADQTKRAFTINTMKPELCTHIVYNGVELDRRNNNVRPIDPELEKDSGSQPTFSQLVHLKERNHHLKLILSVSGSPTDFANLARDSQRLPQFINNVDQYLTRIKFDGVNIDWRYPIFDQKTVFTSFMSHLKATLRNNGRLLTTALHPHKSNAQDIYRHQQELFDVVDYWFIMTPDLGAYTWYKSKATVPFKSGEGYDLMQSIADMKEIFAQHSYKLILALPFGGKQIITNHENTEVDMNRRGRPVAEEPFPYNKICRIIRNQGWKPSWDKDEQVPYAHHENRLITYEDAESVKIKTLYAIRQGLGGVMAYTIEMDDYDGTCMNSGSSYNNQKYNDQNYRGSQDSSANIFPLLQSMYDTVQRGPNSAGVHTGSLALVLAIAVAMIFNA